MNSRHSAVVWDAVEVIVVVLLILLAYYLNQS